MKKILSILLCIFWMGFIYYNSSQNGTESNGLTYRIVDKLVSISEKIQEKDADNIKVYAYPKTVQTSLLKNVLNEDRVSLNKKLRKAAHAFEFFILAILFCNAFFTWGVKGSKPIIYILFIVLFYAVIDEFHQIYVVGRGSSIKDVLIDFVGGIIGIVLYYIFYYSIGKIKKKVR